MTSGSFVPLQLLNSILKIPAHALRVPIDRSMMLDTTYFFAASSIVRAKGSSKQASLPSAPAAEALPPSFRKSADQKEEHRPFSGFPPSSWTRIASAFRRTLAKSG